MNGWMNESIQVFNRRILLSIGEEKRKNPADNSRNPVTVIIIRTVCPGSSDPFYILNYKYIKWVTTSWTYCSNHEDK